MKILVAGGGIGGVYVAGLLANAGHEVTLYEKCDRIEDMRYDWHDDVNPSVFKSLSIPIPEGSYPKRNWTFITPFEKGRMPLKQKEELIDYSIHRKKLNRTLFSFADKVKVEWGAEAVRALTDGDRVVGLEIKSKGNLKSVFGDLIIDSCGVFSPVRRSLPKSFHIPDVSKESVFFVRRFFFEATPGVPFPTDTNKAYMKHIGQKGISWCIACDNGSVDVLIGRVGAIDEKTIEESLADLRKNNPILSDKQIGGGDYCAIPVRRPLSRTVAEGYVCIGDVACMTVPLIGSGIATTLLAAKMLADIIGTKQQIGANDLWRYQLGIIDAFGAEHCAVETMKNWLLEQKNDDIHFFLTSGILRNEDLQNASVGKMLKLEFPDVLHKGLVGMRRPVLLLKTLGMLLAASKNKRIAKKVPKKDKPERSPLGKQSTTPVSPVESAVIHRFLFENETE